MQYYARNHTTTHAIKNSIVQMQARAQDIFEETSPLMHLHFDKKIISFS